MKTFSVPAMFCAGAMALGGWQSQLAAADAKTQPTAPPLHARASDQTAQIAP